MGLRPYSNKGTNMRPLLFLGLTFMASIAAIGCKSTTKAPPNPTDTPPTVTDPKGAAPVKNAKLVVDKPITVALRGTPSSIVWPARESNLEWAAKDVPLTLSCTPATGSNTNGKLISRLDGTSVVVETFGCGAGDEFARFRLSDDHQLTFSLLGSDGKTVRRAWRYGFFDRKPIKAGFAWDGSGSAPSWLESGPPATRPTSCQARLEGGKWALVHDPANPAKGYGGLIYAAEFVYRDTTAEVWMDGKIFSTQKLSVRETANGCTLSIEDLAAQPIEFVGEDRFYWGPKGDDRMEMVRTWGPPSRYIPDEVDVIEGDGTNDEDVWGGLL